MSERQGSSWPVVLGAAAELDFTDILVWTAQHFGPRQAEAYRSQLQALIVTLTAGPDQLGVKARDEIGPGLKTLHFRSTAKRGSHFVLFALPAPRSKCSAFCMSAWIWRDTCRTTTTLEQATLHNQARKWRRMPAVGGVQCRSLCDQASP